MMDYKQLITDPIAWRIWKQYFNRANYVLSAIPEPEREEILTELSEQLYKNFSIDDAFDDAHRMLDAIDKLGEPEDYLKPIVSDIKLSRILSRYNPIDIIKKLYHAPLSSLRQFLFCILLSLSYLFSITVFIISIIKLVIPDTGLYLNESGGLSIGFSADFNSTELLGYWLIPIGMILSLVIYIALTNILKHISDVQDQ